MWVDDDDADIISKCAFSVRSSTLEELKSDVTLGYCLCPALKVLKCTGEIRLERIRASSFEVDYSSLHVLELCYDGSVADINRWLDRLSSMIENMQVLKTVELNNSSLDDGSNKISLRSATVERISIHGLELTKCNCPLLKELHTTNLSSAMACSQQLEKLCIQYDNDTDATDPLIHKFNDTIEEMSKLKRLELYCWDQSYQIEIRSQSLELVSVDDSLNDVDCI